MKNFLFLFFCASILGLSAQTPADDEITFKNAVDWLNSKLDYVYYDEQSEKWWTNTFYVNDNKEVTIKQISSKTRVTADINSKNYTVRTFRIEDINPFNLSIKEVDASTGRLVKGKLLEIRTINGIPKIHKMINNRKATSTSYLHLSFPVNVDSLSNYPELVKVKLFEAIIAATKVYSSNSAANKSTIFNILKGQYRTDDGGIWACEERFPGVLRFKSDYEEKFIGYDNLTGQYFINTVSSNGAWLQYFKEKQDQRLILEDVSDPNKLLIFETRNSFVMDGKRFYRE
ncbi:MAG: hypothetical protein Tsb0034_31670 [Ekhidna sp.]